jgi:hypothetical protein
MKAMYRVQYMLIINACAFEKREIVSHIQESTRAKTEFEWPDLNSRNDRSNEASFFRYARYIAINQTCSSYKQIACLFFVCVVLVAASQSTIQTIRRQVLIQSTCM